MKIRLCGCVVVSAVTVVLAASMFLGSVDSGVSAQAPTAASDLKVMHVQGNVHMIVGAGPNIAASVGPQGVLLVDSGTAASSEKLIATIRGLSPNLPVQYVLNTQYHDSHTGGNEALSKIGRRLVGGEMVIIGHEKVLNRMTAPTGIVSPRPVAAWPTDTFFAQRKEVYFNAEPVQMFYRPGPTDGDSIVFFRKSDVIVSGEHFNTVSFPVINVKAGGHINGIIEGLNDIIDLTVPANNVEDGTLVIPAHGRLSDELDVAVYRDMVTIIRDRVQDAVKRGQTLAQVKADKVIALEYEERYGRTPSWTTEMFLEAIYTNLTAK